MSDHLVITALGSDQPGIVNRLSTVILKQDCNIADSRMAVLGGEFAIILLVNGDPAHIEQLEQQLAEAQQGLGLTIISRRTRGQDNNGQRRPCTVEAVALDHPGIVQRLTGFFAERNINIDKLETGSYQAPHTGTTMFRLLIHIGIPVDSDIDTLRDEFVDYCEEMNIDASLEANSNR